MSNANTTNVSKTSSQSLIGLQQQLGYQFQDLTLLELALTHKSHAKNNNERLEFLGDAVLGYLVAELLYVTHPHLREDAMSLMRAHVVRGTSLAKLAQELPLAAHLRLGSGERKSGGRQRESILADAFEAVIGAIHQDGGIEPCRALVNSLFADWVNGLNPEELKDPKTRLQELLQAQQLSLPEYSVHGVDGEEHDRRYTVLCAVIELSLQMQATASSRRRAEQKAAELVLAAMDTDS